MAIVRAIGLAARVANRKGVLRDAAGRFTTSARLKESGQIAVQGGVAGAVEARFNKPHGHSACGKGQFKSAECKARAIAKASGDRGYATRRQADSLRNYFGNTL